MRQRGTIPEHVVREGCHSGRYRDLRQRGAILEHICAVRRVTGQIDNAFERGAKSKRALSYGLHRAGLCKHHRFQRETILERTLTYFQHGRGDSHLGEVHLIFESVVAYVIRTFGYDQFGIFAVQRGEEVENRVAGLVAHQRQLAVHFVAVIGSCNLQFFQRWHTGKRFIQIGFHAFGYVNLRKFGTAEEQRIS